MCRVGNILVKGPSGKRLVRVQEPEIRGFKMSKMPLFYNLDKGGPLSLFPECHFTDLASGWLNRGLGVSSYFSKVSTGYKLNIGSNRLKSAQNPPNKPKSLTQAPRIVYLTTSQP